MGRICGSDTLALPWFQKNAMVPTPYLKRDGGLRIFLGLCDERTVGRVGYVDVNPDNPSEILGCSAHPGLDVGVRGAFDDNGVLPASVLEHDGRLYLFYSGYQTLVNTPYSIFGGLAVSDDEGESFVRVSRAPLLDRSDGELSVRAATFCRHDDGLFRMWYCGGSDWLDGPKKLVPAYDLKYLESPDITRWDGEPVVSLELAEGECGLALPCVWREDGLYKMIYSIRYLTKGYRLGYAESPDGRRFTRLDHRMQIDVSPEGWDSEMVCYGIRFAYKDKVYLFYCGNQYGTAGFGYAELIKD